MLTWKEHKMKVLAATTREYWTKLWTACAGNLSEVARKAGVPRGHARSYVRRLDLVKPTEAPPVAPKRARRGGK